jgi:hypothetical protein
VRDASFLGEKARQHSSQVESTFRHLAISSHAFFVTIHPKPSRKSETPLISPCIDGFPTAIGLVQGLLHQVTEFETNKDQCL